MLRIRVQLARSGVVHCLCTKRNATVSDVCAIVRTEFGIAVPVNALIYGSPLCFSDRIGDVVDNDSTITFDYVTKERRRPYEDIRPVSRNEKSFRIFTSLSLESIRKGHEINIDVKANVDDIKRTVEDSVRSKFNNVPDNAFFDVFLPGGAIYENGTLETFLTIFPDSRKHLYVVVTTRPVPADDVNKEVRVLHSIKTKTMRLLLSPMCDSTEKGLSQIACLLAYFSVHGPGCDDILFGIGKLFPFAPLINCLRLVMDGEVIHGRTILQITAPLYTIISEISRTKGENVFEHCFATLPYMSRFGHVETPLVTMFKRPFMNVGYERFFFNYAEVDIVPMMDHDFRGTSTVYFPVILPADLAEYESENGMFRCVSVMSVRRQNRICFMDLGCVNAVFLPENASKCNNGTDVVTIIDPRSEERKSHKPMELIRTIGLDSVSRVVDVKNVKELIIICFDASGSMRKKFRKSNAIKLDVAKTLFERFVTRAYGLKVDNFYGLIQFSETTQILSELRAISDEFQMKVKDINVSRGSKLFACIDAAIGKLVDGQQEELSGIPLRIICMTDGIPTDKRVAESVVTKLLKRKIRVDAIFIGDEENMDMSLMTVVRMTGGVGMFPKSVEDGLEIFESEVFFNAERRKYGAFIESPNYQSYLTIVTNNRKLSQPDTIVPLMEIGGLSTRRYHGLLDTYRQLERDNSSRGQRLKDEVCMMGSLGYQHVYIHNSDCSFWKIVLEGGDGSPYAKRWWVLTLIFPSQYPLNGPEIYMYPPPFHMNITNEGRVFCPAVQEQYHESFRVFEIVEEIKVMLINPDGNYPADSRRLGLIIPEVCQEADAEGKRREMETCIAHMNEVHGKNTAEECISEWQIRATEWNNDYSVKIWPREHMCPISGVVMTAPVRASTGLFYEKAALESLIRNNPHARCPITGNKFADGDRKIVPNAHKLRAISEFRDTQ